MLEQIITGIDAQECVCLGVSPALWKLELISSILINSTDKGRAIVSFKPTYHCILEIRCCKIGFLK